MSKKKANRYGDMKVSAASLHPFDRDGYMTKQGGSHKNWNKRYFILKDRALYYYKTPKDNMFTGRIDIEANSVVKEEPGIKKSPNMFSISTSRRIFFMFPDKTEEVKAWIDSINKAIQSAKGTTSNPTSTNAVSTPSSNNNTHDTSSNATSQKTAVNHHDAANAGGALSPRSRLGYAKGTVSFLKDPDSKVLEFWQIWSESIPSKEDLTPGNGIEFRVATSADMMKLTWRASGPQNIFIQKMVDFFWNVGAPESEIDRLNDVGALINPGKIGSWIDMSAKTGMDGGWFFPVDMPLKIALDAADAGDAIKKFEEWADSRGVASVFLVGRDMGAAPPRQTEIKLKLPGDTFEDQLRVGLDAYSSFGFPPIPENALRILRDSPSSGGLQLSVITSSEGFVRLGLLVPNPSSETVVALCSVSGGNAEELAAFEASLGRDAPSFVEYQYLMKNFGYNVYKEGFDIVFHYVVGEEVSDS